MIYIMTVYLNFQNFMFLGHFGIASVESALLSFGLRQKNWPTQILQFVSVHNKTLSFCVSVKSI